MAEKFKIEIATEDFHVLIDNEPFVNSYGTWYIRFGLKDSNNFNFLMVFAPAQSYTDKALKDLKVRDDMLVGRHHFCTKFATQIGDSPAFDFEIYDPCEYLQDSSNLLMIVEIDASSLATPTPSSSSHSLTGFTNKMLEEQKLADITIETEDGKKFYASRFILSRSPVFDAMLNDHDTKEAQESTIKINDIQNEVLKEMIRYMYTDKVPKLEEMALDLILVADKYDLPDLFTQCKAFLESHINLANFSDILDISDKLNVADLKERVIKFIIENHDSAFNSAKWKALKLANMPLGMEVMESCFSVIYKNMQK